MKKFLFLISALILVLALTACSGGQAEAGDHVTEGGEDKTVVEKTKTFRFKLGGEEKEIIVPESPERIVVIGYDLIDIVDALGHNDKIVGVPNPEDPMFPDFLQGYDKVQSVGSLFGDDLESVAGLKPDLILAGARTMAVYDDLNEIAPTAYFTIPGMNGEGFEDKLVNNISDVAYLLNDEAKAESMVEALQSDIEEVKTVVGELDNANAMFLTAVGKSVSVFTDNPESRFGFVYNEFGFEASAGVEEIAEEDKRVNDGEASRHGNSVSFEFISSKNPNHILVLDLGLTTGRSDIPVSDTLDNPLVGSTDAAKNDNIVYLNGTTWYLSSGGIQATQMMMQELVEAFGK